MTSLHIGADPPHRMIVEKGPSHAQGRLGDLPGFMICASIWPTGPAALRGPAPSGISNACRDANPADDRIVADARSKELLHRAALTPGAYGPVLFRIHLGLWSRGFAPLAFFSAPEARVRESPRFSATHF